MSNVKIVSEEDLKSFSKEELNDRIKELEDKYSPAVRLTSGEKLPVDPQDSVILEELVKVRSELKQRG